jgi:O-antigen/teichoic acid export membrane protein
MKDVSIKRKAVGGAIGYGLRTLFLYGVAIGATAMLGIYLDPKDFGVYFVVTAVIGVFTFISDIGLAATLIQKKSEPTVIEMRTTFTVQQSLAILIFLLSVALTPFWIRYAGISQEGLWLLYALAFSFVLASLKTIPSILLERKLEFNTLIIPQVVEQITFYLIAVWLARSQYGVTSFTVAVLCRSLIGVISMYALKRWPIGLAVSKTALKTLIPYGFKFQLNDFLARIKDDLFVVFLSRFISSQEMGYIGWAKKWSMFPYQMSVNSVVAVTFPTFSRLQDEPEKLTKAINKTIFFISLVLMPVLVGMSLMAYPLTNVVTAYDKWRPALPMLVLFSINVAWAAVSTPLTNTLNAIGKISISLRLMVMWTILTWTITPLLLWRIGYVGVALAAAIIGFSSIITLILAKRYVRFHFVEHIWRQVLAAGLMGGFLFYTLEMWSRSWQMLLLGVAAGGGVYISSLTLIGYSKIKAEVQSLWK